MAKTVDNLGRTCAAVTQIPPRPPVTVATGGEDLPDDIDYEVLRRAFFLMLFGDAIRHLDEQQQDLLDRVVWGRQTIAEIAEVLGVPRTTLMDQYKAALAELRRLAKNDPTVKLIFNVLRDLF